VFKINSAGGLQLLHCSPLFRFLLRHELGIIAALENVHPVKFVALDHGPASALGGGDFAIAIPGPFDFGMTTGLVSVNSTWPVDSYTSER